MTRAYVGTDARCGCVLAVCMIGVLGAKNTAACVADMVAGRLLVRTVEVGPEGVTIGGCDVCRRGAGLEARGEVA